MEKTQDDVLNILAHVPGFRQRGGVGNGEGDVEDLGKCLCEKRFTGAGGTEQENVALLKLHLVRSFRLYSLVMVVEGNGKNLLRPVLSDHIIVEGPFDLLGLREFLLFLLERFFEFIFFRYDVVTQLDALVADVDSRSRDEFAHFILGFSAERTGKDVVFIVASLRHDSSVYAFIFCAGTLFSTT